MYLYTYVYIYIYVYIYHCIYLSFQGLAGQGCGHCLQSNVPPSSPLHKSPQTRKHQ